VTVFGPSWNDLTLDDLRAFLADAPSEPLEWEAKAALRADSVRKHVCGFSNAHNEGYLILGAEQSGDDSWALDGIAFNGEPPDVITNMLANGGVTPLPDGVNVRAFDVGDGKHLAVVRVPPIATPPCNTRGTVYERVSGKTLPVTDPTRLAALFARGDAARERATAIARGAAQAMLMRGRERSPADDVQIALGLAADGYASNLNTRPFSRTVMDGIGSSMGSVLARDDPLVGPGGPRITPEIWQDAVLQYTEATHSHGYSWTACIARDGGVGLYWTMNVQQISPEELVRDPIRRAWLSAEELLRMLEPMGLRSLHVMVAGGPFPKNGQGVEPLEIVRSRLAGGPDEAMLASIKRELERTRGLFAFEEE
jgi:hypothetical protein